MFAGDTMKLVYYMLCLVISVHVAGCTCWQSGNNQCDPYFNKRFNDVAFATAHNAQSCKKSIVQNQDISIKEQLEYGIRAFKLPIWYDCDEYGHYYPCVCHGLSKELIYSLTEDKMLAQLPWFIRSRARTVYGQLKPVLAMLTDACTVAYGPKDHTWQTLLPFNHKIFDPAALPLDAVCAQVAMFLAMHPQEIISLILEDYTDNLALVAHSIEQSGLREYAHIQSTAQPWPTLGAMVANNKRVVIFIKSGDNVAYEKFPWMNPLWEFAWDTSWQFKRARDFLHDNVPNRGKKAYELRNNDPCNKIFIVYHFITPFAGGSKKWACKVNRSHVLKRRLNQLYKKTGHIPNFVQVDFFQYPHNDIFKVINELNNRPV